MHFIFFIFPYFYRSFPIAVDHVDIVRSCVSARMLVGIYGPYSRKEFMIVSMCIVKNDIVLLYKENYRR